MEVNELIELEYLESMSEKATEILTKHVVGKEYLLPEGALISQELIEDVAQIVIDVSVANTAIRGFHVLPYVEGHLIMVDVQDKNQQTVASVVVLMTSDENKITVDDVVVAFKTGAILARHQELMEEAEAQAESEHVEDGETVVG